MKRLALFLLLLAVFASPAGTSARSSAGEQEFVPSERIRADAAVSFPVDI
jgi:hypothetical protein